MSRDGALGANVRYRPDTGWEMRCPECPASISHWWPLTHEFWDPPIAENGRRSGRSMTRCRSCWKKRDAMTRREATRRDPSLHQRQLARRRAYWVEAKEALTIKQRERRARQAAEKAA